MLFVQMLLFVLGLIILSVFHRLTTERGAGDKRDNNYPFYNFWRKGKK